MIEIKWIITDNLSNISLDEFENEWNGIISGYLELTVNDESEGLWPNWEITSDDDGLEDILYWLRSFVEGLRIVKAGKKFEMPLLAMNLCKIVMQLEEKLEIRFVFQHTNKVKWKQQIELREFEDELNRSVKKFKKYIKENNPILLNSKLIKPLESIENKSIT